MIVTYVRELEDIKSRALLLLRLSGRSIRVRRWYIVGGVFARVCTLHVAVTSSFTHNPAARRRLLGRRSLLRGTISSTTPFPSSPVWTGVVRASLRLGGPLLTVMADGLRAVTACFARTTVRKAVGEFNTSIEMQPRTTGSKPQIRGSGYCLAPLEVALGLGRLSGGPSSQRSWTYELAKVMYYDC